MTEERIEELLRPIIAQLFEWSVRVRRPSYGTIEGFVQSTFKSTLYTVAAEARRGGIDEVIVVIKDAPVQIKHGVKEPIHTTVGPLAELIDKAERLKTEEDQG